MKIGNPSSLSLEYVEQGRSETCPIIDVHGHYGPYPGGYLPVSPVSKMNQALKRVGIKKIVCSAHEALFDDAEQGNNIMQKTIDEYPDIFLGYWAINPNYPRSVISAIKNFTNTRGFVGFKFLPDYHTYPIDGSIYAPALEYAQENKLIVLVHTWGGSPFDSPQLIGKVAKKYPGVTFLMGHSGYGDWENSVRITKELENVYLDLTSVYVAHDFSVLPGGSGTPFPLFSCLQVNGVIEFMVEKASSRKMVFGTDMPWYSPHYAVGAVLFSRISEEERHDILHRNAEYLLAKFIK